MLISSLITKIHEAGGDIIKFAGDALICVWSLSNAEENTSSQFNVGNMIYHAIHCGFQLASLVEEVEDEDFTGEIKLALHVCVGAGEVNFVTLGGRSIAGCEISETQKCVSMKRKNI